MFSFITRLFKEADDAASERLKMPIVPIYLSLLAFSYWRPLSIFLLSKNTIEQKISLIDHLYLKWSFWDHIWIVILMLVLASLSSALFPVLMWLLDWILLKPIGKRKFYNNETRKLDMLTDLQATQHKYEKNKILSGNKEVEDYNKSIDELTKSYEDRIKGLEHVNQQKQENWNKERAALENQNKVLNLQINDLKNMHESTQRTLARFVNNEVDKLAQNEVSLKTPDILAYSFLMSNPSEIDIIVNQNLANSSTSPDDKNFILDVLKARNLSFYLQLRSTLFENNGGRVSLHKDGKADRVIETIFVNYDIATFVRQRGKQVEYTINQNNERINSLFNFLNYIAPVLLPQ